MDFSPTDVNECLTPGVCAHGRCINLEGSFRCACEQGYEVTSDEKGCQGTKMLQRPSPTANQLAASSLCTHTPSPPLARIPNYVDPTHHCQDLSFPLPLPACQVLTCLSCRVPHRTQWPFSDVNECSSRAACPTGLCLNTEGSFACSACESGYWVNEDGTACEGNAGEGLAEKDKEYRPSYLPRTLHLFPSFGLMLRVSRLG